MAEKGSEEIFDDECDICSLQDISREVDKYCPVCDQLLCNICVQEHQTNKQFNYHHLYPHLTTSSTGQPTHPLSFCYIHNTKQVSFYCKTHETFCCETCKIVSSHSKCITTDLAMKASELNQMMVLRDKQRFVNNLTAKLEHIKVLCGRDLESLRNSTEQCLTTVHDTKKEIDELFLQLETEVLRDIVEAEQKIRSKIKNQQSEAEAILQRLAELRSSLHECRSTHDDTIMCIGVMKYAKEIEEIGERVSEKENESLETIEFKVNTNMSQLKDTLHSIGEIVTMSKSRGKKAERSSTEMDVNIQERTVQVKSSEIIVSTITGSTFLLTGELVLCDYSNKRLLIYQTDLTERKVLNISEYPLDVTAISRQQVVVTAVRELLYVNMTPRLTVLKSVPMTRMCYGICSAGEKIFVLVGGEGQSREIQILKAHTAKIRNRIDLSMRDTRYITVNSCGDRIWVSDSASDPGSVTCLDITGTQLFRYRPDNLRAATGIFLDDQNNILVCSSNNIHVINADGKFCRKLFSHKDRLEKPTCLSYRPRDGTLFVATMLKRKIWSAYRGGFRTYSIK